MNEGRVSLPDGRVLAWAEVGDPRGRPVFYCHGFPGSRLEPRLADESAAQLEVRLIGVDRPGIGDSSPAPGRRLRDWPADLAAVADAFGLDRFAVIGVSAGGPYAAACGWALPERVQRVAVVCGLGPPGSAGPRARMHWYARLGLRAAVGFEPAARLLFGAFARAVRSVGDRGYAQWVRRYAAPDRAILGRPEVRSALLAAFREGARNGGAPLAGDLALLARPWDFPLDGVQAPVDLWHGEADRIVPPEMGHYVASRLKGCRARFLPDEGHFSLPIGHMDVILSALVR
ncbi:MAG: alpha/beta hydrolase [Gammaproteobacteria bacterium]|jgi:pimeloyl-ACP methyl ester carboxylesterase|nr:alpha/beta hydrolase [Gammaproteobacteria bacterium]